MKDYALNETFFISQDPAGDALELPSSDGELVCVAFDYQSTQLVELHLLTNSDQWSSEQFQGLFERLVLLAGVNGGSVPRVQRKGRMDGLGFFSLALEEGEILFDYARRVGGIPELMTLDLLKTLVSKLIRLQEVPRLFRSCSLVGAKLIFSPQGPKYQRIIQVRQFGLHLPEVRVGDEVAEHRLACELGELTYQMLTGHASPVRGGPIIESVRLLDRCYLLRQFIVNAFDRGGRRLTIADAAHALEVAGQFASDSGVGSIGLPPFDVRWMNQIFGAANLDTLYPVQFEGVDPTPHTLEGVNCRKAFDTKQKEIVGLLPLPGRRVIPRPPFVEAPDGLREISDSEAVHLLFPQSTWNSEAFSFHVEKVRNSFSLKHFLDQRGALQAGEIVAVLRQVETGLEEAKSLGISVPSLRTSAIQCVFNDSYDERALQERSRLTISEWPSHQIKIRVHATLQSLASPWAVGADPDRPEKGRVTDAFVLLAIELAGGTQGLERNHLPAELGSYLQQLAGSISRKDPAPEPWALLKSLMQRGGVFIPAATPIAPTPAIVAPEPLVAEVVVAPPVETVPVNVVEPEPEEVIALPIEEITGAVETIVEPTAELLDPEVMQVSEEVSQLIEPEEVIESPAAPEIAALHIEPEVVEPVAVVELQELPAEEIVIETVAESPVAPVVEIVEPVAVEPEPAPPPAEERPIVLPSSSPAAIAAQFQRISKPILVEPEVVESVMENAVVENVAVSTSKTIAEVEAPVAAEAPPSMFGSLFREKIAEPVEPQEHLESATTVPVPQQPPAFVPSDLSADVPLDVTPFPIEEVVAFAESQKEAEPVVAEQPAPIAESAPIESVPTTPVVSQVSDPLEETNLDNHNGYSETDSEDGGVPTLNIDLARLTTADSLFSRRARTITIRNR